MSDFTRGGTFGAEGKTGELAHNAADVSWVTSRALDSSSLWLGLEDVRNTFFNFDFRPANVNSAYIFNIAKLNYKTKFLFQSARSRV